MKLVFFTSAEWLAIFRIFLGVYWLWNGYDDLRDRSEVLSVLRDSASKADYAWYKRFLGGVVVPNSKVLVRLIPLLTIISSVLLILGVYVEIASVYLVLFCLNLHFIKALSVKGLFTHIAPLIIIALAGAGSSLSLATLPIFAIQVIRAVGHP